DGPEAVHELVTRGALPWPVEGLFRLSEIPEPAPLECWSPGFPEWESKLMLAPGTLSVVTGQPGHGKTTLWMQIWYNVCRANGETAFITSFETGPKPHHRRTLRQLFCGKLERHMSDAEVAEADRWVE